ncbi:MAG: RHS repeat-associated core domain-containing protein [Spirochaetaceae bacterium]|nr:RHS repeat-associated core domain-containing protein [Spirochaetaceae bacterium]
MKSGDFVAAYVYGQDGQRSNKYTANSETLYFNKMWTLHTDTGNAVKGGQYAKNIYLGETRIVTKLNSGFDPKYQEEYYKQYFYHSDHLGSASLISDYKGDEYQRLEYTPYGETWVEKTNNTNTEFLPYKFTGKEQDEETGLYYYGARYLDPKYSLWISTDPALQSYIPQGNSSQEYKAKEISQLPGMGGIYNTINGHLYHYAGNNPVKYVDPDGRSGELAQNLNLLDVVKSSITSAGYNLAQYKNWAANASQADGQLPVGDLVGLVVIQSREDIQKKL